MGVKTLKKIISILFLAMLLFHNVSAQNYADSDYYLVDSLEIDKVTEGDKLLIDSCLTVYHQAKHDTDKLKSISKIVEESWDGNVWPKYNLWLYDFTQKKLKEKPNLSVTKRLSIGLASALNNIGYYHSTKGNSDEALKYYKRGLKIQEKLGDHDGVATSLNNIGSILNKQGDVPSSLDYYHRSLKIYQNIDNQQGLGQALNNIGNIYRNQDDPNLALEYFHRALKIFEKMDNKRAVATLLNNIGFAYFEKRNIPKALDYYNRSVVIREEINDKYGIGTSYNNMGSAYEHQHDNNKAMEYYLKGIAIYESIGHKLGLATTTNNVGRMYFNEGNTVKAKSFTLKSLQLAQEIGAPGNIEGAARLLSEIYEKEGNGLKALEMHKLYITMRDSVANESNQKAIIQQHAKYEYEKAKTVDDGERDKLIAIKQKEKEKQTVISYAAALGLILVMIFLLFVFNRLKITRKQKTVIETQNKEIVDSITYAKRIQEAILPSPELINELFPNSFIYYKPKDIVAGDFYWIDKKGDNILFAVADCTGHGVPGAMVSVVCHNAMNSVIKEFNTIDPGEILNKSREIVVSQLNTAENTTAEVGLPTSIRDGMDIALCSLNTKTNELNYAGAYNPLWIIRKGSNEIEEIKANRQSIGKVDNPESFKTTSVKLNQGDIIYLFSDGYADQFGGEKGKKMMYKPFKKLLISMKDKSMNEQLNLIENHFQTWKGDLEQIDDVCVMGIKIG